jgi:hypothetical protein
VSLKEFNPQIQFHSLPNENVISKFEESTGVMKFHNGDDVLKCFFEGESMNFAQGNMGSIDYVTYDYEYSEGGGGPEGGFERTFRGTAILLQSDQLALPSFKWGSSRLDVRKRVQPGIPPKASGFKQCPTCGSLDIRRGAAIEVGGIGDWCEHCKKSLYKMDKEKAEEKIHKLFELVSIADLRGLTALAANTQLLLYRDSWVPAEKYQEFKEKALKIFQMFQSASENLNENA